MWRALVEEGTILNIHLGSSGQLAVTAPDAPIDVMITLQPMNICMAAADLVWSRVFKEFPDLQRRALRGRHRLDPVLPRPARPHLRHAPRVDRPGLRRPPAVRRVPRALPHVLHRRPDRARAPRRHRHRQHLLGAGLPALRLVVAERARGARDGRRALRRARRRARTRSRTRTRCAGTASTRSRTGRASSAPSARCAPRLPVTTCRSTRWTRAGTRTRRRSRSRRWRRRRRPDSFEDRAAAHPYTAPMPEPTSPSPRELRRRQHQQLSRRADPRRGRSGVRTEGIPRRDREGDRGRGGVLRRRRVQLLHGQGRPLRPDLPASGIRVHARHARRARRNRAHPGSCCTAWPTSRCSSSATTPTSAGSTCTRRA